MPGFIIMHASNPLSANVIESFGDEYGPDPSVREYLGAHST